MHVGVLHDVTGNYVFHHLAGYAGKGYGPVVAWEDVLYLLVCWYCVSHPPIFRYGASLI